jgi:hypothetical protein
MQHLAFKKEKMSIDLRFVAPEYPALCAHVDSDAKDYEIRTAFEVYGKINDRRDDFCIKRYPLYTLVFIRYTHWFRGSNIDSFRINLMLGKEMKMIHSSGVLGKELSRYWKVSTNRNIPRDLRGEEIRRREFKAAAEERRRLEEQAAAERRRLEEQAAAEEQAKRRYESKSAEQMRMEDRDIPEYELFPIDYGHMTIPSKCKKNLVLQSS